MATVFGVLLLELLGTGFVIILAVYIYFKHFLYNYWRNEGVAYLEPTFPAGNLTKIIRGKVSIGEVFANAYLKHKSNRYFGMYTFHKPSLVIADPDIIRHVLTKEFAHFHDRGIFCDVSVDPLFGHLFALPGKKWRNMRVKLTPTFTSGKIKQMFATVIECGDNLTEYLRPRAEKREVIEVKDLFARFSTDVIMSTAFGITSNSLNNPNSEFRYWGQKTFEPKPFWNMMMLFAPKIMSFFSLSMTDREVTKFFINAFKETVEYREKNNVVRYDFMNLIIQLMKKGYIDPDKNDDATNIADTSRETITMLEGAAQAFVFFIAGFETTSSIITYCIYELACNQDVQDKVMKDIDTVLEKLGGVTYEGLQEMTYLHKVVSETMRKYPALPVLNRVCTKDIDLPTTDIHLSEGLDVVIPVLGLHRDPDIYPNPDKFDPERFNEANIAARHPYAYLPFGEGPRACIGTRFGYAETKIAVVSVLSKYRVRLGPKTPIPLEMDPGAVIMTVKGGIELLVESR